jgi:hypothetical protein
VHEKQFREDWFQKTFKHQAKTPVSVFRELNQSIDNRKEIADNHRDVRASQVFRDFTKERRSKRVVDPLGESRSRSASSSSGRKRRITPGSSGGASASRQACSRTRLPAAIRDSRPNT